MLLNNNDRFKNKYRIDTIRMQCWDYFDNGYYFVTICTFGRIKCFGEIEKEEMILNDLGIITKKCWLEIPEHFSFVTLDEFIIMPNHIHGILCIMRARGDVDVNVNVDEHETYMRRDAINRVYMCRDAINRVYMCRDAINRVSTVSDGGVTGEHNPMGKKTLGEIIRWFKGKCSFFIHRIPAEFQWQARFYDHVIRSEKSLNRIREYIKCNPLRWDYDRNNPTHLKTLCD